MSGLSASQCPLCRASFKHFSAVCQPLHTYLQVTFPTVAAEREQATKEQERSDWHAESPELPAPPEEMRSGAIAACSAFMCAGCGSVAAPPAVLTCGHVVCARAGVGGWPSGCPVVGCVGTAPAGGSLAVCGVIDELLRAEHVDYEAALGRGCGLQKDAGGDAEAADGGAGVPGASGARSMAAQAAQAAGGEIATDGEALVGKSVELHSLTSAAGRLLNGRRGVVTAFDAASQRCAVALRPVVGTSMGASDEPARTVNARAANLRVAAAEEESGRALAYVHFGRGCDGCGVYPIEGRCFRCADCDEAIGYDMCGQCFDRGVHARTAPSGGSTGRFNQAHRPEHRMEEVEQIDTPLHVLQRAHPEMTVDQIMSLVQVGSAQDEEGQGEEARAPGE